MPEVPSKIRTSHNIFSSSFSYVPVINPRIMGVDCIVEIVVKDSVVWRVGVEVDSVGVGD